MRSSSLAGVVSVSSESPDGEPIIVEPAIVGVDTGTEPPKRFFIFSLSSFFIFLSVKSLVQIYKNSLVESNNI